MYIWTNNWHKKFVTGTREEKKAYDFKPVIPNVGNLIFKCFDNQNFCFEIYLP